MNTLEFNLKMRISFVAIMMCFSGKDMWVQCDHIVFLHTCSSYSHRVPQWPLVEALISKGHKVTYISPYGGGKEMTHPKVNDIIPGNLRYWMEGLILGNVDVKNRIYGILPKSVIFLELVSYISCREMFRSEEFQNWLNQTEKVDLVFADSFAAECSYGLAKKLGAKHALFLTLPFVTKYFESFGISPEASSIPDWDISYKPPLTFLNKVVGALLPLFWRANQVFYYNWAYQSAFKKNLGLKEPPDLYEMEANTSLVLINGDYLEDYARSFPSFVVKVPRMHVKPKTAHVSLEMEVNHFINTFDYSVRNNFSTYDGFIYISFGTVAKGPNLPIYCREIFFTAIEAFPNLKFIWSWNGPHPESYPKNLLLKPWLNQQTLLAHPKIKGFITQAGRPSMQEAFYHGVPTITFPILADQDFNAHRYEQLGTSICMDIATITEQKLVSSIKKIVNNPRYARRTKQLSSLGKDVPMNPVDVAVWWTEFILRHKTEDLNLLKPLSQKQYWYERRELDVWFFIMICSIVASMSMYWLGQKLVSKFLFHERPKEAFTILQNTKVKVKKS